MRNVIKKSCLILVGMLVIIFLWETIRKIGGLDPIVLPSIGSVFFSLFQINDLLHHIGITAAEAATGFLIGNVIAIFTAIIIVRWSILENVIVPYAIALKTTPVVAFAPIILLWLDGFIAKAVAASTVCFFPTLINEVRGLRSIDQSYLDLFETWKANWIQTLFHLRLPSSLPYLFAALKLSSSLSLVGAVVAEFVAASEGLGFLVVIFSRRSDTPQLFATVIATAFVGILFFLFVVLIERFLSKRYIFLAQSGELF